MLKRVLLTLLTLLIVACMVGSVIAMAGTFLLLRENANIDQSRTPGTCCTPQEVLRLKILNSGSVLDDVGYSSD